MRLKTSLAFVALMLSPCAFSTVGTATGTIQNIYTYGDGRILVIGTGFNYSTTGCSNSSGFYIPGSHPQAQRLLASLLAAKATGTSLTVTAKTDGCWYPEITTDPSTYIIVNPS